MKYLAAPCLLLFLGCGGTAGKGTKPTKLATQPATDTVVSDKPESDWIPISNSQTIDGIQISVLGVRVGSYRYEESLARGDDKTLKSDGEFFIVRLLVKNPTKTKRLSLDGWLWTGLGSHAKDEYGNKYLPIHCGLSETVEGDESNSKSAIEPGEMVHVVAMFEKPIEAAKSMNIALDARRIGINNKIIRWNIQRSDWEGK